jgi:LPXTG-motif cell wall-anchored protein
MKKSVTSITLIAAGVLGLASVSGSAGAATLDATDAVFEFGVDGQTVDDVANLGYVAGLAPGTSIRYSAVATIGGTVIDATVTFVEGTNLFSLPDDGPGSSGHIDRIDDTFPDDEEDPFIESSVTPDSGDTETSATLRVDFFEAGTNTPVTLTNLTLNIYDIDEEQWAEIEGIAGYALSTNTHLTVTNPSSGTYRFTSPSEETDSDDGTAFTVGRVKAVFTSTSSVIYTIGAPADSGGRFDADFSNGLPFQDDVGGGEDTSTLPATGAAVGVMAGIAVAMIAGGAALGARRRTRA